jgi:integrase
MSDLPNDSTRNFLIVPHPATSHTTMDNPRKHESRRVSFKKREKYGKADESGERPFFGYWLVCYDRDQPKGKRRIEMTLGTEDESEAYRRLHAREAEFYRGEFDPWNGKTPDDAVTVEQAVARYLKAERALPFHDAARRSDATLDAYEGVLNRFVAHIPSGLRVAELEEHHIRSFVFRPNLKPATSDSNVSKCRVFLDWCKEQGYTRVNPAINIRVGPYDNKKEEYLTRDQHEHVLQWIDGWEAQTKRLSEPGLSWLRTSIILAVESGLRRKEICFLRWADVDIARKCLHIRSHGRHRTKNRKNRKVRITPRLLTHLKMLKGVEFDPNGYVVTGPMGGQLDPDYLSARVYHYFKRMGLPDGFSLHSLRHTHASWLAMDDVKPQIIQRQLGHSRLAMTERYMHLAPDHGLDDIDRTFSRAA